MSKRQLDTECANQAKAPKQTDQHYAENQHQGAAAVEVDPPIFKILVIDYFEKVADYLPLKDLHAIGQTCKAFHESAATVFKANYSAVCVKSGPGGIYIGDVKLNGFCDCIQHMIIDTKDMNFFRFVESKSFTLINHICLIGIKLNDERIACIKKILGRAEYIEIRTCDVDGEFNEKFLQFCTSMKRLAVEPEWFCYHDCTGYLQFYEPVGIIGTNNDWMLRQYPVLEQFELKLNQELFTPRELKTFLERNQNIRKLATNFLNLDDAAGLKLDVFATDLEDAFGPDETEVLKKCLEMDKTGESFFDRLHIYCYQNKARSDEEYAVLSNNNKLESFHMQHTWTSIYPVLNLKELRLEAVRTFFTHASSGEDLVKCFINVERVSFGRAKLVDILAVIGGSPKLVKLRIESFDEIAPQNGHGIDLLAWNNRREQLVEAKKVTVYVEETVFLATKCATRYGQTDFSLVTLKRHESHGWDHIFAF